MMWLALCWAFAASGDLPPPECGLHSLFVSLRHLQDDVTVTELRKDLGPVPLATGGYSLGQLSEVFERRGFFVLPVETNVDNLLRRPKPFTAIASVDDGTHFISILDVDPATGAAQIFDSREIANSNGIAWIDRVVLESRWNGTALLASPEPLLAEEDLPWTTMMIARMGAAIAIPVLLLGGVVWLLARRRTFA